MQSIKLMSLILQDNSIHDMVFKLSDFQFLVGDIDELSTYPSLYPEEAELLLYVLRIFGELAKSPRIAELNLTNGVLVTSARILTDTTEKFSKETKIWALTIINRCCLLSENDIRVKTL